MNTFDNFKVTEHNKFAFASTLAMTEWGNGFGSILALHGASKDSKTHLLEAAKSQYESANHQVVFLNGPDYVKEFNDRVIYGEVADYMEGFVKIDALIVDNVTAIVNSDDAFTVTMFKRLVQGLVSRGSRILVAFDDSFDSEDTTSELQNLLTSGVVAEV